MFPSPTGVNYYESQKITLYDILMMCGFPSPTGVNYYELKTIKQFNELVKVL